jgi:3-methyladenine DNA glycosylase AlkD
MTRRSPSPTPDAAGLIDELRALGSDDARKGMARFGINTTHAFGVTIAAMRLLARPYRRQHDLAAALWKSGYHEARILATLVDDPKAVTSAQMDAWVADFDSWDLCDQACANLFARTPFVEEKILQWAEDDREFVRRAAFALLVGYTVHGKNVEDRRFVRFLPVIEAQATDGRNFVRKAVNWALRQIGKRSMTLHKPALALAKRLAQSDDKTARWIGRDAVRELSDPRQIERLARRQ